jgi:hypothetical protein
MTLFAGPRSAEIAVAASITERNRASSCNPRS